MLYEVITTAFTETDAGRSEILQPVRREIALLASVQLDQCPKLDRETIARFSGDSGSRNAVVITSYSIHYTKLYEWMSWPVPGAPWRFPIPVSP